MHFTQREQRALRQAGVEQETIEAASEAVVAATDAAATDLEAFFADRETVYSDMDRAHSASEIQTHAVEYLDLFTHADDIRGYLRFDSWGVPVEGGRVLSDDVVELRLGPTVNGRVRFAADEDAL
ncbi:hypothetical protein KTS45_07530 [Halomicroarcula limicola]|uniref:Uncharacterized protein n=1 Tax=Haloarcula limicola TaxID=1429915 RepID=A0A8J7YCM8_9EURY|nr:hypothetical protein [Halomicroarcula limicola]MBV0924053.1 hypothetical protein [Halomicroarcula limicola]